MAYAEQQDDSINDYGESPGEVEKKRLHRVMVCRNDIELLDMPGKMGVIKFYHCNTGRQDIYGNDNIFNTTDRGTLGKKNGKMKKKWNNQYPG